VIEVKKILIGMIAIVLVTALLGAGVWAYFQDTETSIGNIFQAGTLDLKIRQGIPWGSWGDGVTATWTMLNMKPGQASEMSWIEFRNDGSITANHLEIACDYLGSDEMAKMMIITHLRYDDATPPISWMVDLLNDDGYDPGYGVSPGETGPKVEDVDGDEKITLYDLKYSQDGNGVDNLWPPNGDETTQLEMKIRFDPDAGNGFQGQTLDLTIIFTLNQDANQ